jgi:hypothetical protein
MEEVKKLIWNGRLRKEARRKTGRRVMCGYEGKDIRYRT